MRTQGDFLSGLGTGGLAGTLIYSVWADALIIPILVFGSVVVMGAFLRRLKEKAEKSVS